MARRTVRQVINLLPKETKREARESNITRVDKILGEPSVSSESDVLARANFSLLVRHCRDSSLLGFVSSSSAHIQSTYSSRRTWAGLILVWAY